VLPSRAVPPRRNGSCHEQRGDDSRHERWREAAASRVRRGGRRDRVGARRPRERLRNDDRRGAYCRPRRGQRFVRRLRRERPLGPRGGRAQRSTGLRGGRRRMRLSDGMHRPHCLKDGWPGPRPRRGASPWPRRRVPRFRNRRGLGRRCDRDRCRRRWSRLRPRHRFRRRRLTRRTRLGERRQEEERIEVPLRVGGLADAQVHVRHGLLGHPARAHHTNRVTLGDGRPSPY